MSLLSGGRALENASSAWSCAQTGLLPVCPLKLPFIVAFAARPEAGASDWEVRPGFTGGLGESSLKCLIIAAGMGQRLAERAESKPLLRVGSRPLIDWVIFSACRAGIREFVVVTGFAADKVESHLRQIARKEDFSIDCIRNEEWEKENGLSVFKAREASGDRFILSMSDHIVDPEILKDLMQVALRDDEMVLAADFRVRDNPLIDIDDVTKVLVNDGKIRRIGKTIKEYNAFDTGLFLCSKAIFSALEQSQKNGDFSLSGGVKVLAAAGKAGIMDIGNRNWIDVDDPAALKKAEALVETWG